MSEPFLGEIRIFGFQFAPKGWAFCQGQLLPRYYLWWKRANELRIAERHQSMLHWIQQSASLR